MPAPEPLTLLADCVFDGAAFRREPLRLDLAEGRIAAVRPARPEDTPAGPVLDARGATVLPGLINTHTHIARGGMFGPSEPFSLLQVVRNLRSTLAAGVTTIGDMGCAAGLILALRAYLAAHPDEGPAIVACGPILTAPGGYPFDWLPGLHRRLGVARACASADGARRTVHTLAEAGLDHVKLAFMHRSYGDRPLDVLDPTVARAAVAEAHALGMRAYAHAHSVADYDAALAAGVDALMHSSFEPLAATDVARVRATGARVCPTLWVFESVCLGAEGRWDRDPRYTAHVSRPIRREWGAFCDAYAVSGDVFPPGIAGGLAKTRAREATRVAGANLLQLRAAGVPLAFGTDAAYAFCSHARPVDELRALERAGLSPAECLRAATSAAAELLGRGDRGTLAPGLRADFAIVAGDAERDLGALERVRHVLVGGRLVRPAAPGAVLRRARAAAAVLSGLARTVLAGWRARD